jgi:hypothetical protein
MDFRCFRLGYSKPRAAGIFSQHALAFASTSTATSASASASTSASAMGVAFAATLALVVALGFQTPCDAEFDASLDDPYFRDEFQWAMFVEMKNDRPFVRYPGSQLNPLTVVRITSRIFPQDLDSDSSGGTTGTSSSSSTGASSCSSTSNPSRLYEEFWYHGHVPIGLKRYNQLKISPYQFGVVVLASTGNNNNAAAANVIVRLLLELELQRAAMAVVMVPMDKYDQIASELGHYSFFPGQQVRKGMQTGIRLTSYPFGKDRLYYLNPARF